MTQAQTSTTYSKARIVSEPALVVIQRWLKAGVADFRAHLGTSLVYGVSLFVIGWITLILLFRFNLGWMVLPSLAGG